MEPAGFWIAKGICSFCEGGALLFRTTSEGHVFVICEECDSCYLEPADAEHGLLADPDNEGRVPIADGEWFLLRSTRSATKEEIETSGWGQLVGIWRPIRSRYRHR
jgi:hypothetical protein